MELRLIRSFVTVAETGHVGRAAERLHISQPPLTRQIQQLERELGVQLFVRGTRGVELTDAGAIFLNEARTLLMLAEQARERVQRAGHGEFGRFDVAVFGSAIFDLIPRILLAFRRQTPDVHLVLHTMNRGEQIEALRQRRINAGFNRFARDTPDIAAETIIGEPLFVAVNHHSPLSHLHVVPLRSLVDEPLVLFPAHPRPSFIDFVLDLFRREGLTANVVQEVGDPVTGTALVGSGFGTSLVPRSATNLKMPGVVYRPLRCGNNLEPVVDLSILHRLGDDSPILRRFLNIARQFSDRKPPA